MNSIAFVGGGTGGHLYPGVALAERARERFHGCRTLFVRTSRAIEDHVFDGLDLETLTVEIRAPGKDLGGWLRYSREASRAQRKILATFQEGFDLVFGLGGYASLPGVLAARLSYIPVILLEQNGVSGRANRLLAPFVDAVACACPESRFPLARRREVTGNPVRRGVLDAARQRASLPRHSEERARRTLLVVGGSQGAEGLNRSIRQALPSLLEFRKKIYWIHITGNADKASMEKAYRTDSWDAEVHAYSPELPALMARSDLVLGRAGATTLSELTVLGLPSILVPYPHHCDEQQRLNAEMLVHAGGARLIYENRLNADSLRAVFRDVLFAPERLQAMGASAQRLARPDAADAILDLALDVSDRCPSASVSSC